MRPPTDNALVLGNLREYRHNWYIAKKQDSLGYIYAAKVSVYLQPLLRNRPGSHRIQWNNAK